MKKSLVLLLFVLASISIVNAAVEVEQIALTDTILPGQGAEYLLSIKSDIGGTYSLGYSDDYFRAKIDPSVITLVPGSSLDNIKVTLYPLGNAGPGSYIFKLRVVDEALKEVAYEYPINVVIVDKDSAIKVDLLTPSLDPELAENLVQVRFTNNYNIKMEGIRYTITSKLFLHEGAFNLDPSASTLNDFIIRLDNRYGEGDYELLFDFKLGNTELTKLKKTITIGKLSDVKKSTNFAGGLFTKVKEVRFVNDGNDVVKQTYSESLSALEDFFTVASPDPDAISGKGDGRRLSWEFELEPGESKVISVTTGYRGFVIVLILLLVIIGVWYFMFGKEVTITKKVSNVSGENDTFGSIKVNLHIRNRSKFRMHNLRVMDKIPGYVLPVKEEFSGMHPVTMKRGIGGGMVMVWNIPGLDSRSEHVISYRVKTKMPVFGKVVLPTSIVKYRTHRGKILQSYSNKMILFSLPSHSE